MRTRIFTNAAFFIACFLLTGCVKYNVKRKACTQGALIVQFTGGYFFAPGAFTPDGDGVNDLFGIAYAGATNIHLTIKDRLGDIILERSNLESDTTVRVPYGLYGVWDGQYKDIYGAGGAIAPNGIYPYTVSFTIPTGETKTYSSEVSLLIPDYQGFCIDNPFDCQFGDQWDFSIHAYDPSLPSNEYIPACK